MDGLHGEASVGVPFAVHADLLAPHIADLPAARTVGMGARPDAVPQGFAVPVEDRSALDPRSARAGRLFDPRATHGEGRERGGREKAGREEAFHD